MMQFHVLLVVMASMVAACYAEKLQLAGEASFVPAKKCEARTSNWYTVNVNPRPLYTTTGGYLTIYWQCTTRKPRITRCNGTCDYGSVFNPIRPISTKCECCRPTQFRRIVPRPRCRIIRCKLPFGPCTSSFGYHPIPHNEHAYYVITQCQCKGCPGNQEFEAAKRSADVVDRIDGSDDQLPEDAKMEDAGLQEALEEVKKDARFSRDPRLSSVLSYLFVEGPSKIDFVSN